MIRGPLGAGDREDELDAKLREVMKKELRRSQLALRKAFPASAQAERSAKLAARASALDVFRQARTVAAYVATRGEADPLPLVQAAWSRGATVVLPRVERTTGALVWHVHAENEPLEVGAFGIREPSEAAPRVANEVIDLVLVPAVALDVRGHRIGMGKGFYGRALPELRNARRVGIVFDFQLVAEVPSEPHDVPVEWVVTDARTIDARSA